MILKVLDPIKSDALALSRTRRVILEFPFPPLAWCQQMTAARSRRAHLMGLEVGTSSALACHLPRVLSSSRRRCRARPLPRMRARHPLPLLSTTGARPRAGLYYSLLGQGLDLGTTRSQSPSSRSSAVQVYVWVEPCAALIFDACMSLRSRCRQGALERKCHAKPKSRCKST